jgi:hypothetical protein
MGTEGTAERDGGIGQRIGGGGFAAYPPSTPFRGAGEHRKSRVTIVHQPPANPGRFKVYRYDAEAYSYSRLAA